MTTTALYAEAMLQLKREEAAKKLSSKTTEELELIVRDRPFLTEPDQDLAAGLFGSEQSPIIQTGAAYNIIRERRGELYAYSLIDNQNNYPIRNKKTNIGKALSIGVPFVSVLLGAIDVSNYPTDPAFSYFIALTILNSCLSIGYGGYLYLSGHKEGMKKLEEEMQNKAHQQ